MPNDDCRGLGNLTVDEILAQGRSVSIIDLGAKATSATIFTTWRGAEILRIEGDGRLTRGKDFPTDDAASVAFFECLAHAVPCYLATLRQRAEKAEAALRVASFQTDPKWAAKILADAQPESFTGVSG